MTIFKKGNNIIQPVFNNNFGADYIKPTPAPAKKYLYPNEQGMIELKAGETYPMVVMDTSTWEETLQDVTIDSDAAAIPPDNYDDYTGYVTPTNFYSEIFFIDPDDVGGSSKTPEWLFQRPTASTIDSTWVIGTNNDVILTQPYRNFGSQVPVLRLTLEFDDLICYNPYLSVNQKTIAGSSYGNPTYTKHQTWALDANNNVVGTGTVQTGNSYCNPTISGLGKPEVKKLVICILPNQGYSTLLDDLYNSYYNIKLSLPRKRVYINQDRPVMLSYQGHLPYYCRIFDGYYAQQFPNADIGTIHFTPDTNNFEYIELK